MKAEERTNWLGRVNCLEIKKKSYSYHCCKSCRVPAILSVSPSLEVLVFIRNGSRLVNCLHNLSLAYFGASLPCNPPMCQQMYRVVHSSALALCSPDSRLYHIMLMPMHFSLSIEAAGF